MSSIPTYSSAPVNANRPEEMGPTTTTSSSDPATSMESSETTAAKPPTPTQTQPPTTSPRPAQPAAAPAHPTPAPAAKATTTTSFPESASSTTCAPPAPQPVSRPQHPTATGPSLAPDHPAGFPNPAPAPPEAGAAPAPAAGSLWPPPKAGAVQTPAPSAPTQTAYTQPYSFTPGSAIPNSTSASYGSVYPTSAGRPAGLPLHNGGGGSGDGVGEEEEGFLGAAKGWLTWGGGSWLRLRRRFGGGSMTFMRSEQRVTCFLLGFGDWGLWVKLDYVGVWDSFG
ncbi:uncharacterized protein N7529_005939 [Penicillium soppii]|uniref:uncharacterized protein n=1 Tax=Penicillium soppii TaxID=69789 RepID=UPI0025479493|nr:uncharacterized protein N7529_005939 [Penicillium soppii]KAJ5864023.1 hypothetical protein N7529_005939 [Penicillium soppii]